MSIGMYQLMRVKFTCLKRGFIPLGRMFNRLQTYRTTLYYHSMKWRLPDLGWIKFNMDEACKEILGIVLIMTVMVIFYM